jgi:hypothetical protein
VNVIALAVCIASALSSFYERLQAKDRLRSAEYGEVSAMLVENTAHVSTLSYFVLITIYYMAQTERYIQETYNKYAYPSHQERIDVAKKYLAQQEA